MKKASSAIIFIIAAQFVMAQNKNYAELLQLPRYTSEFYYSPGKEKIAKDIAISIESATKYFKEELEFIPKTKIFVLGPEHWKKYAAFPVYGMPHNIDMVRLAVASDENDFWQSFLPPLDKLPAVLVERIKTAYRNADKSYSMRPFFNLLAIHELGHSYHGQKKINMQRKWMQELFVNIMLHTYVAEKRQDLLPALTTFPEMVVSAGSAEFRYTSLSDFEEKYDDAGAGMTAKNYGWYQCNFHHAAKNIYDAGGKKVLNKLWTALQEHPEKLNDIALVQMLNDKVHPSVADVYRKWNQ